MARKEEGCGILAHLPLGIRHGAPFRSSQNALFGRFGLVAKYFRYQTWIGADPLQEHEVCAEGFLGGVGVLDVTLA